MRRNALCLTLLALLAWPPPAHAQWFNDPYHGMVTVCNAPGNQTGCLVARLDGSGYYLLTWMDYRIPDQPRSYYQILNEAGIPQLEPNGRPVIGDPYWYVGLGYLVPDGEGGLIGVFRDARDGSEDVYGQRFDPWGNPLWGPTGLPLIIWPGPVWEDAVAKDVVADSLGNFFVSAVVVSDIYIQKFQADGIRLWGDYGAPVCVGLPNTQEYQQSVPDMAGGIMDVWHDDRWLPSGGMFYFQHLDEQGNPFLQVNGAPVRYPGGIVMGGYLIDGVADGQGGGVWCRRTTGSTYAYLTLFRLNGQGQTLWQWSNSIPFQGWPQEMLRHPSDGTIWLSSWENRAGAGYEFFLYRHDISGHPLFGQSGLPYGGEVMTPTADGVIIFNSNLDAPHTHLTASRIDSSGALIWTSPVGLNRMANAFVVEAAVNDGEDGAVLVFLDLRNASISGGDISAQRILSDGSLGNPPPPPVEYHPGELILAVSQGQVRFTLPAPGPVKIELFDLLGRRVALIQKDFLPAGAYAERFDSAKLPSGIYILRLSTNRERQISKVAILK